MFTIWGRYGGYTPESDRNIFRPMTWVGIHDICECVAKRVQEEAVDRQQGKAGSRELRTTAASAPPARVEIFTQACCGSSHGPGEGGMERV